MCKLSWYGKFGGIEDLGFPWNFAWTTEDEKEEKKVREMSSELINELMFHVWN